MINDKIIEKVNKILIGIDETEINSDDGWWEVSTGAEFGKEKLNQLLNLLKNINEGDICH